MKKLFKQVLIVVLGIFIALGIAIKLLLLLVAPSKLPITDKTVLHISLRGRVVEHAPVALLKIFKIGQEEVVDLMCLKAAIQQATKDQRIQGIYLEADALKVGWASLEEIRQALLDFQQAGKFIVAYGENYTQKTYYLASVADEIVLHPEGLFPLIGLSQTVIFYKTLLDKLEVAPQVFRVGAYKSAIEPFIRQDMSQENKHQSKVLLHGIHDHFLDKIATARALSPASLQAMSNALSVVTPDEAYQAKLVSQVGHFDAVEALTKTKLALKEEAAINYVAYDKYAACHKPSKATKKQIAIIIAEGTIMEGKGGPDIIGAKELVKTLKKIREDRSIKAVVLRINSPGGSSLASSVLWKEIALTTAKKPVVASLSDVAASGGYYMAVACNRIIAHPTTITGSIGIFGLFFDVHALLKNKLGITTDVVKTNDSADFFSNPGRPISLKEKRIIQKFMDTGYATFVENVALGRKLDKATVEGLASGRVWSGKLAQEKGLVDALGGLEEAIQEAAKLASIQEQYTLSYWPKSPNFYEQILDNWRSSKREEVMLHTLQANFPVLKHVQALASMTGIQARLPYTIEIE